MTKSVQDLHPPSSTLVRPKHRLGKLSFPAKTRHLKFIYFAQATALLLLGGCALVNWFFDPYSVWQNSAWQSPTVRGINRAKPYRNLAYGRLFKAVDVARIQPRTIFLGSSRTEYGLDPEHGAIAAQPSYNLALAGADIYEAKRYFRHALVNQPDLQTVVIGIDFFMFNEFEDALDLFEDHRLEQSGLTVRDALNATLSLQALEFSRRTLAFNREHPDADSPYDANGLRSEDYSLQHDQRYRDRPIPKRFEDSMRTYLEGSYREYQLSPTKLNHLRQIVEEASQAGVEVKIFISPSHAAQWEAVYAAGLWDEMERWKRAVSQIAPVWDFSTYNDITTEPIQEEMQHYLDGSHYRRHIGDRILDRLFQDPAEAKSDQFGVLITPRNIEFHLPRLRAQRQAWAIQNSAFVRQVQQLASDRPDQLYP